MFYRDLILTVDRRDRMYFVTQLMTLVHEHYSALNCAVAFPGWQDGEQNSLDSFDTFTRYADVGDVIRLFADDESALGHALTVLGLEELVAKRVIIATPVKPAPTSSQAAAFCRVRSADGLGRRVARASSAEQREKLKESVRARSHQTAYFRVLDKSGNHQRPIVFTRVCGNAVSGNVACNSFGFSSISAPCYLPDF